MKQFTHNVGALIVLTFLYGGCYGYINVQGDVMVAGLFGVFERNGQTCSTDVDIDSVMTVEAVKWYIEKLNEQGNLQINIGLESFETCQVDDIAAEKAVEILNRDSSNGTVIGVLGPEKSSEAEAISRILGAVPKPKRLLQIGFSTTATRLGNALEYNNFARVIPDESIQFQMMVKSMEQLKWNRIAVVYEDNIYGQEGYTQLRTLATKQAICIALNRTVSIKNGISANEISNILEDILIGVPNSRPPINGIVLIASKSVANFILLSLGKSSYSPVPIIMFSEGTQLDDSVFKQYNGDVIAKSKGSLLLTPPYLEISEFIEHWNAIFTNSSFFDKESKSNQWLFDVLYKVIGCASRKCDFRSLTDTEIRTHFTQQPLQISYAIKAVHTMIKAVTKRRTEYCQTKTGSCTGFVDSFKQGDMIDAISGLQINFQNDFSWTPDSLQDESLEFDQSGTVTQKDGKSSYELFNIQSSGSSNEIKLEKIGELIGNKAQVTSDKIRDYRASGEALRWPDVRRAQCSPGQKCSECTPLLELQERVLFEPGDVYLVGVVPIFHTSGTQECGAISDNSGYQLAESIRFAVEKVNEKSGDYSNFYPELKVGSIIINSCRNPAFVQRKIYDLHANGVSIDNNTVVKVDDKILGYVAEYTSTVSMAVASTLSFLKFVQISYASTSPALSDRSKFPYFMRVVTPDDAQAKAMVEMMKKLNADYIQIIHSAGDYGEAGRDKVKEYAASNKICVIQNISFNEGDSEFQIYDKLRTYAQAKIVVVFLYPNHLIKIMSAFTTQMKRGDFVFIGSEAWARDATVLASDKNQVLLGSFTVSLEMYKDRELRNHAQNIKSKTYIEDPWAMLFVQAKRKCYFDLSFDKTQAEQCSDTNDYSQNPNFKLDTYDTQAYVAAKSLLAGANEFLKSKCGSHAKSLCKDFTDNTKGLVNEILNIKMDLDGSGNKMKVFDKNGDGNVGYRIYNIQKDDDDLSILLYKEVGRYPLEGTFTFEASKISYPNDVSIVSRCPNKQACSNCYAVSKDTDIIDKDSKDGETNVEGIMVKVLGALFGVAVIIGIVLAVLLCRQKKQLDSPHIYMRARNGFANDCETVSREATTPSKIYMEIPVQHERRYVPMSSASASPCDTV